MKGSLLLSTLVVLAGCSTAEPADERPVTRADITTLIGSAKAKHIDSCKVLPLGKKACGGPEGYVVYSSETITNEQALLDAIYKYNEKAKEDAKTGISNCQFIPEPKPQLKGGVCWIP